MEDILNFIQNIPDDKFDRMRDLTHIAGGIFVGNWHSGKNDDNLNRLNIRFVICLSQNKFDTFIHKFQIQIPDDPSAPIENYFDSTYNYICENIQSGNNVLIMSDNGVSRAPIIAIYYFIRRYYETQGSVPDILTVIKFYSSRRPCDPDPEFIKKIINAVKSLQD